MELLKFGDKCDKPMLVPFTLFFAVNPPIDEIKEDELTGTQTMMPLFLKDKGTDLITNKILNSNSLSNE